MTEEDKNFIDVSAEFKDLGADSDKKIGTFEGYGAVFNNKDHCDDVIVKGAFAETLRNDGLPAMLLHHKSDEVIGIWTEAYEDERGLYVKGSLNLDVQKGREAYALLKQGALKGLSIGYLTKDYSLDQTSGVRTLKKLQLLEVSIVTFPANPKAKVAGVKFAPQTEREFEKFLRDSGYGKTQAKAIVSGGFKAFLAMQRDADAQAKALIVRRDADEEVISSFKKLITHMKGEKNEKGNQRSGG